MSIILISIIQSSTLCNTSPTQTDTALLLIQTSGLRQPCIHQQGAKPCDSRWKKLGKSNFKPYNLQHYKAKSSEGYSSRTRTSTVKIMTFDPNQVARGEQRSFVPWLVPPPLPNSKLCLGWNFRNSTEKSGQPKMKLWDWKSQHSVLISPVAAEYKYTRWIEKNKRSNQNEEDTQRSMYFHQKGLSGISWKCQMFQDCLGELCSSFDGEQFWCWCMGQEIPRSKIVGQQTPQRERNESNKYLQHSISRVSRTPCKPSTMIACPCNLWNFVTTATATSATFPSGGAP